MGGIAKERSRTYWPTMRLVVQGSMVEIGVFAEGGGASFVMKNTVTDEQMAEILSDVRAWIERQRTPRAQEAR